MYKGQSVDASLALTTEINFGAADIFVGAGYNYNVPIGNNPVSTATANSNSYTFITTGIDYRISPQIDLNATVRIPLGGGSNSVNYIAGASWNF